MRIQTATLAAAAKSGDRAPIVGVRFSDEPCERPRFSWSEVYTETAQDTSHAACTTHHGTIIRWRVQHADQFIYRQRITDPTNAAQWSTWTKSGEATTALHEDVSVDLWADQLTGVVFAGWMGGALGNAFHWTYSLDDGVTWAAAQVVKDYGMGIYVRGVAGIAGGGTSRIVVAVLVPSDETLSYLELFTGSGIDLPTSTATTVADLAAPRGLGMCDEGDGTLLVWYADKDPKPLEWGAPQSPPALMAREWFAEEGIGWSSGGAMATAGVGGPITFQCPRVYRFEVEPGVYRYVGTWQEISASASGGPAYQRGIVSFTTVRNWIGEQVPWRYAGSYGLEVLRVGGYWYLVQSDRAYRSAEFDVDATGSRLSLDETRVRSVVMRERANLPGEAVIELDNSDGYLDGAGTAGAALCVRPGAQVGLALGYRTSGGRELIYRQPLWVSRVEHGRDGRKRVVTVEARDAIGELASMRARRDLQLATVGVVVALEHVIQRVSGAPLYATSGGPLSVMLSPWRVAAGASWAAELARLARAGGVLMRFANASATGVGWSACGVEWVDYGEGASAWTVGGEGGSPFYQGRWWRAVPEYSSVEVEGTGFLGESRDWSAIWRDWRDVVEVVSDRRLGDQTKVDKRATGEARLLPGASAGGVVRIGLVPGLEVGDVVTVTDELAGVTAEERYVTEIVSRFQIGKGIAEQELTLEAMGS